MSIKINFLLIIFTLCSCTANFNFNQKAVLQELEIIREIPTDFVPGKSLYNKLEDVTFIKAANQDIVYIYKGSKKINKLGTFGSGSSTFNKISDIALAPDGHLLVLDSFQRKIVKIDTSGKYITEFELEDLAKPILMDISLDETLYVYDESRKEIYTSNFTDQFESFSFGKFMLSAPGALLVNNGLVQVFDKDLQSTLVFDLWGELIEEYDGFVQTVRGNQIRLNKHYLTVISQQKQLAVNVQEWSTFSIKYSFIVLSSSKEIKIFKINYEN